MKGTFLARMVASESGLRESKKQGTPEFFGVFKISEGEHQGERYGWDGWLTEKAQARTIEALILCGLTNDDLSNPQGIEDNIVAVVLDEEEYTNEAGEVKVSTRVAWVNDRNRSVGTHKPMAETEAKSFADTMKGAIMAQREKSGKPADDGAKFDFGANTPPAKPEASKPSARAKM